MKNQQGIDQFVRRLVGWDKS